MQKQSPKCACRPRISRLPSPAVSSPLSWILGSPAERAPPEWSSSISYSEFLFPDPITGAVDVLKNAALIETHGSLRQNNEGVRNVQEMFKEKFPRISRCAEVEHPRGLAAFGERRQFLRQNLPKPEQYDITQIKRAGQLLLHKSSICIQTQHRELG